MNNKYVFFFIIILTGVIFLQRECTHRQTAAVSPPATIVKREVIKGDPVPYEVPVPKPYPVYRDTGHTYLVPYVSDSAAVVKAYFARNAYHRILKDDSVALIVMNDTVTRNELGAGSLVFQSRKPTSIITYLSQSPAEVPPRFRLFAGFALGGGVNRFCFGPAVMAVTSKEHAYGLNYELFNKLCTASIYWKLGFRRKVP